MTFSLILAALLALGTVWFLATAIRRNSASAEETYDGLVQLRDRLLTQLRELDVEEGDRNVDAGVAADERRRLEGELAQVLKAIENHGAPLTCGAEPVGAEVAVASASSQLSSAKGVRALRRLVMIALAVVVPLSSAALYFTKNGPVLARLGQTETMANGDAPVMVQEMVARLERRLADQPDDAQGWAMLGRSYDVLGRIEEARTAYARAYALASENAEIIAAYAGFLMARDPSNISSEAVALFRKLHALDPQHAGALWALGFAAYQGEKFEDAVQYWEKLREQLPADSEVMTQVRRAIEQARAEARRAK